MINKDRIVPVTATDLISLYSVFMGGGGSGSKPTKVDPVTDNGVFEILEASSGYVIFIFSQPVKEIKVNDAFLGSNNGRYYLVPDYDFAGVTKDGAAVDIAEASEEVTPDGCSLYQLLVTDGAVKYTKIGF